MKLQIRSGGCVEIVWDHVSSASGVVASRVVLRVSSDKEPDAEVFLDPGEVEAIAHALHWQQEQLDQRPDAKPKKEKHS